MKDSKLIGRAALNSFGVLVYVFLISLTLNNGAHIFGPIDNKMIDPIIFLLLFIFSALLTGFLILGKPTMLYLDGLKKEGIKLLFYTGAGLFFWLLLFCAVLLIAK